MRMIPGAKYKKNNNCSFTVWAPKAKSVKLLLTTLGKRRTVALEKIDGGYWYIEIEDVTPDSLYFYRLEDLIRRPDPASYFQPEGVHGPSAVIDHQFPWKDIDWPGIPLEKMIIYELHVGAFSKKGTFEGIIKRLNDLSHLGVNAIELMPVAQFSGERNWGYDGVFPYAVQNSYGGVKGLKKLINACHQKGLAVILDVVYNHLGPEGNHLHDFGPYFTDKYQTPWGQALNFDGPYSDQVRDFFFENALYWFREYHIDALRLDALHAVFDDSAKHFLEELSERVEQFSKDSGHQRYLIGESDLNDIMLIKQRAKGGYGLDAQWCDDFHHSLHALLTKERNGYYQDFGKIDDLAKALKEGFVYSWNYSKFRKRHHGSNSKHLPARKFVVCIQNHDQTGNRMLGKRLSGMVSFEALKLAAGAVILSPYIPLLFMGQEYAEESPFQFFVSYTDQELIKAVRKGRAAEFDFFQWKGKCPDPQSIRTFKNSNLNWEKRNEGKHRILLNFYRKLINFRKTIPNFVDKKSFMVRALNDKQILLWHRRFGNMQIQCLMNFSDSEQKMRMYAPHIGWTKILDSADKKWKGPGSKLPQLAGGKQQVSMSPLSVAIFEKKESSGKQKISLKKSKAKSSGKKNVYENSIGNVQITA
jgi:maltooligosyltrehalose trehalohydrolase